jgi:hypothetical protein
MACKETLATCSMTDPEAEDFDWPLGPGQPSPALRARLQREDLLDLEVVLRYRGVKTLRALNSMDTTERAVLGCKARQLWELLGIFPSNLKTALIKLFHVDAPVEPDGSVGAGNNAGRNQ